MIPTSVVMLQKMLDDAAERGAKRALESLGLHDADASKDINDLRTLVESWRSLKKSVSHAVASWVTMGVLAVIAGVIWTKFGNSK